MAKKHHGHEVEEGKAFAFLGVFLTIIGFLIVILAKKENKYAMFYAKQGLVLFIAWIIIWVLGMIPFIGWFIILPIGGLIMLVLWIIGWVYALSGEKKYIPLIGKFADKFDI